MFLLGWLWLLTRAVFCMCNAANVIGTMTSQASGLSLAHMVVFRCLSVLRLLHSGYLCMFHCSSSIYFHSFHSGRNSHGALLRHAVDHGRRQVCLKRKCAAHRLYIPAFAPLTL